MADLMDYSNEINETLGRNYNVPDDIDEEELLGELDALEADMALEEAGEEVGTPSYQYPLSVFFLFFFLRTMQNILGSYATYGYFTTPQ